MSVKIDELQGIYERYRNEFINQQVVLGDGNPDSKLMLVGEAPGREEVRLAKPFVGAAGKNLNEFLDVLGIGRDSIYISNAIKYRLAKSNPDTGKVSNRPALRQEVEQNRGYLLEEIRIIDPEYIITLGNVPLRSVTGENGISVGSVHGSLKEIDILGKLYRLFPLYHPASIIYNRSLKEIYINDIKKLKDILHDG